VASSHRILVTIAVGLVELTAVLSLWTSGHHRPDAGTDGGPDGRTVRTTRALSTSPARSGSQIGTAARLTSPPAPEDQRRRRRRRMLQAVAAVLVSLVAVNFTFPFS